MEPRILDPEPVLSLDRYVSQGGGRGLDAARRLGPIDIIDHVEASGLRGRGGAGFPTGVKWRTVAENLSPTVPPSVVINAAEGEPGSFKDRMILRRNPYKILEGALVAATAIGADRVTVAMKASFEEELDRVREAIAAVRDAGWADGVELAVVEGPSAYLYGEETALLEVVAGRAPFPRIAPPFRHGVEDVGADPFSAAHVTMAGPDNATPAPPTLVNNAETLANVPGILAEGPDWYRSVGTAESPGTVVCTITGHTRRHGVAEFAMGTPLREVVDTVGGGPREGVVVAALSGVANPLLPGAELDAPVSYEGMKEAGAGLGAAAAVLFAVNVTAVLPVTPSNVGVFQFACMLVLGVYGVGQADALAYGIVLQAVEVATAVALGSPALVKEGLSWREVRVRALHASPVHLEPLPGRASPERA
ncbi:MAG: hypothetical protein KY452_06480 [Actinobacteria bacterium]|nr:hypothetical protein [Actinomycetota bacterium]